MKKLISFLCAASMAASLTVMPVSAEEDAPAVGYALSSVCYLTNDSGTVFSDKISLVTDEVDGVEKPVVKVDLEEGVKKDLKIQNGSNQLDAFGEGTFRLTAAYRCNTNPGQGRLGIRRGYLAESPDKKNCWDNSPAGTIIKSEEDSKEYTTVSLDFTIDSSISAEKQFAGIRFNDCGTGEFYLADMTLQKKQADDSWGENILPALYTVAEESPSEPTMAPSEPTATAPAETAPTDEDGEFETEVITSLEGYYFIDKNDAVIENGMEMVTDNVNGVERPVIRLALTEPRSDFGVNFDDVPDGDYILTATYYCLTDPGEGRFGLRRENAVNYPDSSPIGAITQTEGYVTVTKNITVNDNGNNAYQYARIRFTRDEESDSGYCYISEFKLQPVSEDGEPGGNLLPEFYTKRIVGTTEGWSLENTEDTAEIAYATVNGMYKPVMKWSYQSKNSHLRYWLDGALEKGSYRISVTYYSPKNPGTGRVGIRKDINGSFPDNNTTTTIVKNTTYETVTRDVTVENDTTQQYLDIACEYGDAAYLYVSEVKLQMIHDDGSLGENLIANGDFMQRKLPPPDQYEVNGIMFDVVDDAGQSLTGREGVTFIPNTNIFRLSASANVKNNGDDEINPVLIVAMYYDGVLQDTASVPVAINAGEDEDITVYMSIPDSVGAGKLTAKAFLWEDTESMKPVTTHLQIEESDE